MKDKLLVYYSYTGNTKFVAKILEKTLGCDVLEIKPQVPFSSDYNEVVREYQNNRTAKRAVEIQSVDVDLTKYNTVIIGTPVWWYSISPPIRTFLKENDFAGKTVIPFATSAGWFGKTLKEFEDICKNSKIEKSFGIVFDEDYSLHKIKNEKEFNEWVKKLEV